jgi:outer membrane murein-binding lipoprotein Lpp
MKTKKLVLGLLLSLFILSCSKDDSNASSQSLNSDEAKISANIDAISEDISQVVDDQFNAQAAAAGRSTTLPESILPPCATVTVVIANNTWTRTVTFATGCTLPNGNVVSGTIIVSGSTNFSQQSHTISYSFVDFYHNNILVQGNKTVVRNLQSTATLAAVHPVATMNIDLTVTYPNANVYHRVGTRVRELIEGFETPMIWLDNIFSISGSWTTTFSNGTQSATITTPLIAKASCPRIVSGVIQIVRNNNTGTIDYGDGTCDNLATVTINGVTTVITLGGN